jgi:hypothetical protein
MAMHDSRKAASAGFGRRAPAVRADGCHRMGESGSAAADGRFSKKDPSLAAGRSLGRNGKVSRFASQTKRKNSLAHERNRAARHEARRPIVRFMVRCRTKSSAGPPTIRRPAAFSPSQCRAVLSAANAALWQRTMRSLRLDTKKVELVRLVFSIGVTIFVSVGTFLAIRYLIGSSG